MEKKLGSLSLTLLLYLLDDRCTLSKKIRICKALDHVSASINLAHYRRRSVRRVLDQKIVLHSSR